MWRAGAELSNRSGLPTCLSGNNIGRVKFSLDADPFGSDISSFVSCAKSVDRMIVQNHLSAC